jgi:hypothetical protein
MIIANIQQKIKQIGLFLAQRDVFFATVLVISSIASYTLGTLESKTAKGNQVIFSDVLRPIEVSSSESELVPSVKPSSKITGQAAAAGLSNAKTTIFASKSGTKYYYSWCKSGNRVKLQNRVYYSSKEAAEKSGKSLAANCTL